MWKNCGFKIYKLIGVEYIGNGLNKEIETPEHCCLEIWEITESLRTCYYSLEEEMEEKNINEKTRNEVIGKWIRGLAGYMATVSKKCVEDLIKECTEFRAFDPGDSEVEWLVID